MKELQIVEYNGILVLTTQQIAEAYGTNTDIITKNYNRNKDRYIEGKHFICLKGNELKDFRANGQIDLLPNVNTLYLWTEKGCFLHAKSLGTDKAWEVYDRLVDDYFEKRERKINNNIEQGIAVVKFIADDLRVSESSRLYMYENYCRDVGIPTSFIPKYEDNGSRERCSATELLKRNDCGMSAAKFNQLLLQNGYLEERERPSSNGGTKKFKALTEKGLEYGVNLINEKNQKEVQPHYYVDTFMKLYKIVTK